VQIIVFMKLYRYIVLLINCNKKPLVSGSFSHLHWGSYEKALLIAVGNYCNFDKLGAEYVLYVCIAIKYK